MKELKEFFSGIFWTAMSVWAIFALVWVVTRAAAMGWKNS
jgi:hypothetical protein